jgi:hypothetical protein
MKKLFLTCLVAASVASATVEAQTQQRDWIREQLNSCEGISSAECNQLREKERVRLRDCQGVASEDCDRVRNRDRERQQDRAHEGGGKSGSSGGSGKN